MGLIPTFWGIRRREDIAKTLEDLESLTHAAYWLSNLDIPARLIAIPEGRWIWKVDKAKRRRTAWA